jgi:hypothetical protein
MIRGSPACSGRSPGFVVGMGAVRPAGDDHGEGESVRPRFAQPFFQLPGQLPLAHAWTDKLRHLRHDAVGDRGGGADDGRFRRSLHGAQRLYCFSQWRPLHTGELLQLVERLQCQMLCLDPDPGHAGLFHKSARRRRGPFVREEGEMGRLDGYARRVAGVGGQQRLVGRDQQLRVGAGEAGEPAPIDRRGDQYALDVPLG